MNKKFYKDVFIHETSFIDNNVTIGNGTKIWHFSHVLSNCKIGENCTFGQNVVTGPRVNIGNDVKIQNNVCVYEGVTLEDGVFCGPSCVFTNVNLTQVQFYILARESMTPLERAKKSAEIMWKKDRASKGIGIKIER